VVDKLTKNIQNFSRKSVGLHPNILLPLHPLFRGRVLGSGLSWRFGRGSSGDFYCGRGTLNHENVVNRSASLARSVLDKADRQKAWKHKVL